jgi:DNA segregation ATPase FtsK/SpoIIIE, S-DNA-T family
MGRSSSKSPTSKSRSRTGGRRKTQRPATPVINLTLDQKLDILGIALVALGGFTLLSKLSLNQGSLTKPWLDFLSRVFGWGVYFVPLVLLVVGGWLLLRSFERVPRPSVEQAVGYLLALLVALLTLQVIALVYPGGDVESIIEAGAGGGSIGEWLRETLVTGIGAVGTGMLMLAWWLVALVMCLGLTPSQLLRPLLALVARLRGQRKGPAAPLVINNGSSAARSVARPPVDATASGPQKRMRPQAPAVASAHILGDSPAGPAGPLYRTAPVPQVVWELPKIEDIFELGGDSAIPEDDLRIKANIIEETLHHLGVEGKVIEVNRGPAITQFGVEPGFITSRDGRQTKVKVSRITALADDLALALAARTIRIEAPVPGRNIVGIEVPNAETALVALRDVMESESFAKVKTKLAIALGQDVSGQPMAADLAAMPHLLIAGTTGSGKSVCVNAIIACLLTRNTPDDLRLLMVDPKRVELTTYNGIPHLMAPVVVDLERVVGILQWVTREMDTRYHKFAKAGARNIDDFNKKVAVQGAAQRDMPGPAGDVERLEKLPYIVVIIDELADLMMLAPDETERTICRLAQMARATGIHLILATQRPSVDVVTGLIKANFPARISFAVASSVDSRVILDGPGAEQLLGRGDMLFVSPESGQPVRLQGCYVSDKEILKLTRHWKGTRGTTDTAPVSGIPVAEPAPPVQQPLWEDMRATVEKAKGVQEDNLLGRAIEVVKLQRRASISLLQRKLQIGYTRAARLIDLMEQKGVVSPAMQGERWREVLVAPPGGVPDTGDEEF